MLPVPFCIYYVICQIHLPYKGYFCPQRLLCTSSNEKRLEICIREQFVTRMVPDMVERLKIAIFTRKRTRMLDFLVCLFCYDIKLLVS